ncbi:hypothetical protein SKAU_G00133950 [Synaphobranchus kaupii]|uniref:Uncharacterized protein n=1 Tax=Synaphobranchus kaupii TaxID=118154 RepID=A0A9Q1J2L9_SYNKA|nr:hypothetical protein SKAU_G00133950 [Synaphobranchus kaupii]
MLTSPIATNGQLNSTPTRTQQRIRPAIRRKQVPSPPTPPQIDLNALCSKKIPKCQFKESALMYRTVPNICPILKAATYVGPSQFGGRVWGNVTDDGPWTRGAAVLGIDEVWGAVAPPVHTHRAHGPCVAARASCCTAAPQTQELQQKSWTNEQGPASSFKHILITAQSEAIKL